MSARRDFAAARGREVARERTTRPAGDPPTAAQLQAFDRLMAARGKTPTRYPASRIEASRAIDALRRPR